MAGGCASPIALGAFALSREKERTQRIVCTPTFQKEIYYFGFSRAWFPRVCLYVSCKRFLFRAFFPLLSNRRTPHPQGVPNSWPRHTHVFCAGEHVCVEQGTGILDPFFIKVRISNVRATYVQARARQLAWLGVEVPTAVLGLRCWGYVVAASFLLDPLTVLRLRYKTMR